MSAEAESARPLGHRREPLLLGTPRRLKPAAQGTCDPSRQPREDQSLAASETTMTLSSPPEQDAPKTPDAQEADSPSPRAFAIATGFVFQSVGMMSVLGVCCFWSLTTYFVPPDAGSGTHWMENLSGERLASALVTIGVAVSLVGGMGLIGVGVGLQAEQPSSGWAAMIVTSILAMTYWVVCALFVFKVGSWSGGIVSGLFAAAITVLFALSTHSAGILRRFPPPPNQNVVTDEFLEQHRYGRRRDG